MKYYVGGISKKHSTIRSKRRINNLTFEQMKQFAKQCVEHNNSLNDTQKEIVKLGIEESIYKQLIVDKLGVNIGMVMENVVAQSLVCSGYELFFHRFDRYEVDFLLTTGKKLIPIEVKSSSYSTHKSLDYFQDKYSDRVKNSYVIYSKDLKHEGNITYIPFYMTMFL